MKIYKLTHIKELPFDTEFNAMFPEEPGAVSSYTFSYSDTIQDFVSEQEYTTQKSGFSHAVHIRLQRSFSFYNNLINYLLDLIDENV